MADIEVHIDIGGRTRPVGLVRSKLQASETVVFEYDADMPHRSDRPAPLA